MFWINFLSLCAERGLSPNAVAAECGIKSSGTVTGWKNGSIPRQSVLLKIADYFDCTIGDLLGETKMPITKSDEHKSNPVNSDLNREELKRLIDRLTDQEVSDTLADVKKKILG